MFFRKPTYALGETVTWGTMKGKVVSRDTRDRWLLRASLDRDQVSGPPSMFSRRLFVIVPANVWQERYGPSAIEWPSWVSALTAQLDGNVPSGMPVLVRDPESRAAICVGRAKTHAAARALAHRNGMNDPRQWAVWPEADTITAWRWMCWKGEGIRIG